MVHLLLVDDDVSFRLGFRAWLEKHPGWRVTAEAGSRGEALGLIADQTFGLVVIELAIPGGLELCRDIKQNFPATKLFILTRSETAVLIEGALALGVEGYGPKGIEAAALLSALSGVAMGYKYRWRAPQGGGFRLFMRDQGFKAIDGALFDLNQKLGEKLPPIERLLLAGRGRELRCARWLVSQIWKVDQPLALTFKSETTALVVQDDPKPKLRSTLHNLTDLTLEIDILLPDRRQELLSIVLAEFHQTLERCRRSELGPSQIKSQWLEIITDLWERVTGTFVGEYRTVTDRSLLNSLLQDRPVVERAILGSVPLVPELLCSLLFQTPLEIDYKEFPSDSPQARQYAQDLLDNLCIHVANAVIQPLLNSFAQEETIKQRFFQYRSSREIERFRNELSWQYRYRNWVREPRHIFESRQELWIIDERGIDRVYVNYSRTEELKGLKGWQFLLTLLLEFQDALNPRVRAIVNFVGRALVFLLTEVIGRGIGLIGKGIMRGIGYAWQPDGKIRRHN